jgi:hypothetical protein
MSNVLTTNKKRTPLWCMVELFIRFIGMVMVYGESDETLKVPSLRWDGQLFNFVN